jgi:hypothetical protein
MKCLAAGANFRLRSEANPNARTDHAWPYFVRRLDLQRLFVFSSNFKTDIARSDDDAMT